MHQQLATRERVIPFTAGDGMSLNLVNVQGPSPPTRAPVILVHGAGVRSGVFRAPVPTNIVDALVARGHDVWLENWRASIDLPPNRWTLDQAALHDHPAAVRKVVEETGADRVKAIIHCQGSTSFMMSACAGLVPQVDTIITNAVSLHPVVPLWSRAKLRYAVPIAGRFLSYLDPSWGDRPPPGAATAITLLVKAGHHECASTVCKLVSFTYGSGFPALWRHENLDGVTHDAWIPDEFGPVPLTFFRQMDRCVRRGHLVAYEHLDGLPDDYTAQEPRTDARIVFLAGQRNRCFLPESQRRSYDFFSGFQPRRHALHVLPGYSHLDVFFGGRAHRDVFPLIAEELAGSGARRGEGS
ncbi:esterase [Planomonospora sp. ID67723]|nr:esterase [Planomonospora sp. ID67723]